MRDALYTYVPDKLDATQKVNNGSLQEAGTYVRGCSKSMPSCEHA
jgi:hypothetical protein